MLLLRRQETRMKKKMRIFRRKMSGGKINSFVHNISLSVLLSTPLPSARQLKLFSGYRRQKRCCSTSKWCGHLVIGQEENATKAFKVSHRMACEIPIGGTIMFGLYCTSPRSFVWSVIFAPHIWHLFFDARSRESTRTRHPDVVEK